MLLLLTIIVVVAAAAAVVDDAIVDVNMYKWVGLSLLLFLSFFGILVTIVGNFQCIRLCCSLHECFMFTSIVNARCSPFEG